jgi:hypothetical protein
MKTIVYAIFFSLMLGIALSPAPVYAWGGGQPPWDAPVVPGAKLLRTETTAAYYEVDLPYEQVLAFYKDALKNYKDPQYQNVEFMKYRDWADQMYIEDQGGAKWHSIGISKGGGSKTAIKIVRDNMTWVMSTLLIRFAGVFFVLCTLWLLLNVNSFAMKRFFPEGKAKAKA